MLRRQDDLLRGPSGDRQPAERPNLWQPLDDIDVVQMADQLLDAVELVAGVTAGELATGNESQQMVAVAKQDVAIDVRNIDRTAAPVPEPPDRDVDPREAARFDAAVACSLPLRVQVTG